MSQETIRKIAKERKLVKIGKNWFRRDREMGYYPAFSMELRRRIVNKEACVVTVTGEAGTSKSYTGVELCQSMDKRFTINQIVYTYSEYIKELQRTRMYKGIPRPIYGLPILFDEPSYAMSKRDWYNDINKALQKTVESQRFMVRPLVIPVINLSLIDKTTREYLVIFQAHMYRRGKANVYRLQASPFENKIYRHFLCRLSYSILDAGMCSEDTCLGCDRLADCNLLRAQYERKKLSIQLKRYEQDADEAVTRESKELTDEQLCKMVIPYKDLIMKNDVINANLLRVTFYSELKINIGNNKSQYLKGLLERMLGINEPN